MQKPFTLQKLLNFQNAANEWLRQPQSQQEAQVFQEKAKTLLADCIIKISPQIQAALNPLNDLAKGTHDEINVAINDYADQHIIEQSNPMNGQPSITHKHIFIHQKKSAMSKAKDSYKEFTEEVVRLQGINSEKRKELLESTVMIEPCIAESLPSFKLFPDNELLRDAFSGLVIAEKSVIELVKK